MIRKRNIWLMFLAVSFLLTSVSTVTATSLWNSRSSGFLFVDHKARSVGDLITIIIKETVSISKKGETETEKSDSVVGRVASFLFPRAEVLDPATANNTSTNDSILVQRGYKGSRFGQHNGVLPAWDWKTEQSFKGGGSIKNDDTFSAKITARIIEVLPNGNMLIEGKKTLLLANEKQNILITGIIRAKDILEDNTIDSEKISDFNVRYEGKGPIGDNQKRGLLTKVWDAFGLI